MRNSEILPSYTLVLKLYPRPQRKEPGDKAIQAVCSYALLILHKLRATVDQEIFVVKIIHILNFHAFNFRCWTVLQCSTYT